MKNRASTNAVDGHSVDQVRLMARRSGAHRSGEETEGMGLDRGIAEPSNLVPGVAGLVQWEHCYGDLWKLKVAFDKKHYR